MRPTPPFNRARFRSVEDNLYAPPDDIFFPLPLTNTRRILTRPELADRMDCLQFFTSDPLSGLRKVNWSAYRRAAHQSSCRTGNRTATPQGRLLISATFGTSPFHLRDRFRLGSFLYPPADLARCNCEGFKMAYGEYDDVGRVRVRRWTPELSRMRETLNDVRHQGNWDVDTAAGFTRLPHKVIEKLAHAKLSGPGYAILLVVIRKTLGWNKYRDAISQTQFMKFTGLDKRTVQEALHDLTSKNFLKKLSLPNPRKSTVWALNRLTNEWPVRQAKPVRKSPASIRYMKAARRGGESTSSRAAIRLRTKDKGYIRIKIKKGSGNRTAVIPEIPLTPNLR